MLLIDSEHVFSDQILRTSCEHVSSEYSSFIGNAKSP